MKRRMGLVAAGLCALLCAPATAHSAPGGGLVDLTGMLQAVVSLSVALITAFLIPWIRGRYTADERRRIAAVYETVVYAAEQLYGAGRGGEKLDWAIGQLEARGLTADRAAIEAQVRHMQSLGNLLTEDPAD